MNPDAWPKGQIALHLWAGCGASGPSGSRHSYVERVLSMYPVAMKPPT